MRVRCAANLMFNLAHACPESQSRVLTHRTANHFSNVATSCRYPAELVSSLMTRPHALHLLACVVFIRLRQRIRRSTWPPTLFCTRTAHIRKLEENNEHSPLLKCLLLLLDVWSDRVCDYVTVCVCVCVCVCVYVCAHAA